MTLKVGVNEYAEKAFKQSIWDKKLELCQAILPPKFTIEESHWSYLLQVVKRETIKKKGFFKSDEVCEEQVIISDELHKRPPQVTHLCIYSLATKYDKLAKEIALIFASNYDVTYCPFEYNEEAKGTIRCQYCGRRTSDLKKCEHCGGEP